jgi:2-polyprenyl-3-methyl-5-hydroxy-6-metoxy-1,4-benzoquinol methylase
MEVSPDPTNPNEDSSLKISGFRQMEQVRCPVCDVEPRLFAVDHQGFRLCRCPVCKLEFANPRPTLEELRELLYQQEYFYLSGGEQQIAYTRQYQFHRQLNTIFRLLRRKGRLLDFGCGDGAFLAFAQNEGWEITGTDIRLSEQALRLSCKLVEGQLGQAGLEPGSFDAIRINHVLEHTQNPLVELQNSGRLVAPGGIIYISVPNLAGISSRMKSLQSRLHLKTRRWRHYAAIHHLWYFTPSSLKALVEKAGLRTVCWETPVLKKPGRKPVAENVYRFLLEKSRFASILDLYCSPNSVMLTDADKSADER